MLRVKQKIINFLFYSGVYLLPSAQPLSSSVEIRVLLGHQFITMFMYSLDSFFQATGHVLPVLVVDDGSLTQQDKELLAAKFTVKIYSQKQLLNEINPLIKKYPYLHRYFTDKNTNIKKFRVASMLLPATRMILYEADVLFHRPSPHIRRWLTAPSKTGLFLRWGRFTIDFLKQSDFADLSFRKLVAKSLDLKMPYFFNAGVCCTSKITPSDMEALEKICRLFYEIEYIHHVFCDELLLAVPFHSDRDRAFNSKYYTTVWSETDYTHTSPDAVLIHYAGKTKERLKTDVVKKYMKRAFQAGMLGLKKRLMVSP